MIRCIAVDDEPLALAQMARFIGKLPELELVGKYYSVEQARQAILAQKVDVLFLDIEMPDCNGVDFARSLGEDCPYIIFTTAYPQYAVDGFRLDAVDYLLKPLSIEEMAQAIEKVKRRMGNAPEAEAEIFVKSSGTVRKIVVGDILYVKGLGEYVQILVEGEHTPVTTFMSMKGIEKDLAGHGFMRVHKSYLVNLAAITSASRTSLTIGAQTIPVGEKYRPEFAEYLRQRLDKK